LLTRQQRFISQVDKVSTHSQKYTNPHDENTFNSKTVLLTAELSLTMSDGWVSSPVSMSSSAGGN